MYGSVPVPVLEITTGVLGVKVPPLKGKYVLAAVAEVKYPLSALLVIYPLGFVALYGVKPRAPVTSLEPIVTAPVRLLTLVTPPVTVITPVLESYEPEPVTEIAERACAVVI
jgi:hypothetical protein